MITRILLMLLITLSFSSCKPKKDAAPTNKEKASEYRSVADSLRFTNFTVANHIVIPQRDHRAPMSGTYNRDFVTLHYTYFTDGTFIQVPDMETQARLVVGNTYRINYIKNPKTSTMEFLKIMGEVPEKKK